MTLLDVVPSGVHTERDGLAGQRRSERRLHVPVRVTVSARQTLRVLIDTYSKSPFAQATRYVETLGVGVKRVSSQSSAQAGNAISATAAGLSIRAKQEPRTLEIGVILLDLVHDRLGLALGLDRLPDDLLLRLAGKELVPEQVGAREGSAGTEVLGRFDIGVGERDGPGTRDERDRVGRLLCGLIEGGLRWREEPQLGGASK